MTRFFDYLAYGNARQVEYIGSVDTTLAGSRSGLAPIALWYAIAHMGTSGFVTLARHMLDMADYARCPSWARWASTRGGTSLGLR